MCKHYGETTDKKPDDIHDQREASRSGITLHRSLVERQERHLRQFQRLQTEGNTDYRNHQTNTGNNIFDGNKYATEYYPDHIPQRSHLTAIASISTMQFLGSPLAEMADRAGNATSNC